MKKAPAILFAILAIVSGFVYRECRHREVIMGVFQSEKEDAIRIVKEYCDKNMVFGRYGIIDCLAAWSGKKASELPRGEFSKAAKEVRQIGGEIIFRNYITNRMIIFLKVDTVIIIPPARPSAKSDAYQDFDEAWK